MANKVWYRVRIRICLSPPLFIDGKWRRGVYIKKSKFYLARGSKEAGEKYKGPGQIMNVQKWSRDRLHAPVLGVGLGGFLRLGDELLNELKEGGTELEKVIDVEPRKDKDRRRKRFLSKQNLKRGFDASIG